MYKVARDATASTVNDACDLPELLGQECRGSSTKHICSPSGMYPELSVECVCVVYVLVYTGLDGGILVVS